MACSQQWYEVVLLLGRVTPKQLECRCDAEDNNERAMGPL